MTRSGGIILAAAVAALSCAPYQAEEAEMSNETPFGWVVKKDGKKVQWIDNAPGMLVSLAAPPPPDAPPRTHPFISTSSFEITEEGPLYRLLERADSFDRYVELLRKNGYEVVLAESRP